MKSEDFILHLRFIGELFNLKMLTENIVHGCLSKLMRADDEDNLQCFCILILTTGKELDTDKAKVTFFLNISKQPHDKNCVYIKKKCELCMTIENQRVL